MTENKPKTDNIQIEIERSAFKTLLAQNPNYFGNLVGSPFKPVKTILGNTTYEEISCVGFNPDKDLLEATIKIKLPFGYGTDLCHAGTFEYVRFYLDYGSGWEDAGVAGFNIHDIPNIHDCAGSADKPLAYVVSRPIDPTRNFCGHPVLPKVRAILSWNHIPPPATPNWPPIWGNVVDRHIQIRPRPWLIRDMVSVLAEGANLKLKVPPLLQAAETLQIPIPAPPPLTAVELAGLYGKMKATSQPPDPLKTTAEVSFVPPHRFAFHELQPALTSTAFSQAALASKATEYKAAGLDWAVILAELLKTSGDTQYEQLDCLGLDYQREWLVATLTIKRPTGYSGNLCQRGSTEHVAFWADWDNKCQWQYMGTVQVQVHDIPGIPGDGLHYAAILPVDLAKYHRGCNQPRISRLRAVLSWNVAPSTVNPEAVPYWGNRLDAHVQVQPGHGSEVVGEIRAIGGIPVEDIDAGASGFTLPSATFWYDGLPADDTGLHRPCPFGGQVLVHGQFFLGHKYRVKVRKVTDLPGTYQVVTTPFSVLRWAPGSDPQTAVDGFFTYLDPALYMDRTLAVWNTSGDDQWELQLDVADMASPPNIQGSTPWYRIQLDNTAPVAMITPDVGECKKWLAGDKTPITGHFTATDANFGKYVLSTHPNTSTTPSNQPSATTGQPNTMPTSLGRDTWQLYTVPVANTDNTVTMKACGYVVRLDVSDRAILNSLPGLHNRNAWETGFCLVDKL